MSSVTWRGVVESPVYAILKMNQALKKIDVDEVFSPQSSVPSSQSAIRNGQSLLTSAATGIKIYNAVQPFTDQQPSIKWDGEWHITIEVFRDLGLAFAAVLVLIYILMVGWFRSFLTRRL